MAKKKSAAASSPPSGYLEQTFDPPSPSTFINTWTVDLIRGYRVRHDLGEFLASSAIVDALVTDPRVLASLGQRVSTPVNLTHEVKTAELPRGAKGKASLADEARDEVAAMFGRFAKTCPPHVQKEIVACFVMCGVAIAQNVWTPKPDGSRWDVEVRPWPIEYVVWNNGLRKYQILHSRGLETIEHGDGKWIIFAPWGYRSWMRGALRALSMPWADRQYGVRYRSQHAAIHGTPMPIGTLPANLPIDGLEGKKFQTLIRGIRAGRTAGVKPYGSVIEMLEAKTVAFQIFNDIVKNGNEDIAIALLGQDGTIAKGSVYTPPMLEGVRFDLVEDDAVGFDAPISSGMILPWTLVNHGDADVMPHAQHQVPNPEEDQRLDAQRAKWEAFAEVWTELVDGGFERTQDAADALAADFNLTAPMLAEEPPPLPLPTPPGALPPPPPPPGAPPSEPPATQPSPAPEPAP